MIFIQLFILCLVPILSVSGLQGLTGVLACDVTKSGSAHDVSLILWFKDNATKPMYR